MRKSTGSSTARTSTSPTARTVAVAGRPSTADISPNTAPGVVDPRERHPVVLDDHATLDEDQQATGVVALLDHHVAVTQDEQRIVRAEGEQIDHPRSLAHPGDGSGRPSRGRRRTRLAKLPLSDGAGLWRASRRTPLMDAAEPRSSARASAQLPGGYFTYDPHARVPSILCPTPSLGVRAGGRRVARHRPPGRRFRRRAAAGAAGRAAAESCRCPPTTRGLDGGAVPAILADVDTDITCRPDA